MQHAKPLTAEEIEGYRKRVTGETPFPGTVPKGVEAVKAALDGWHARNLATLDMLKADNEAIRERMEAALAECQCPDCKCRDQIDAECSECGCDSPICARPGGLTLAAWALSLHAIVERLPKTADGAPITPGMLVWEDDDSKQVNDEGEPYEGFRVLSIGSEHSYQRQRKQWVVLDGLGEVTTDRLYSTREAAISAAEAR